MSTETRKRATATPASGRYSSAEEFLAASGVSKDVQKEMKTLSSGSRLTTALAVARTKAGITQTQMAEHLGCTQSAVSKLEAGTDGALTLSQIMAYSKATKSSFGIHVGKTLNQAAAVTLHA